MGVGALSPQHRVWPETPSLQCGMGKVIVVEQESNATLCSKLWPNPGNELQQSSDDINVEITVDRLPFRHTLFLKK
jgi:hypothetical protein